VELQTPGERKNSGGNLSLVNIEAVTLLGVPGKIIKGNKIEVNVLKLYRETAAGRDSRREGSVKNMTARKQEKTESSGIKIVWWWPDQ